MLSEDISTPIYVECNKMYQSKGCVQEFSYIVSCVDIQLEQSQYNSPNSVAGCEKRRVIYRFFQQLIRTYGLVVKASRRESDGMDSIPDERCNNMLRSGHFAWD